MKRSFACLLALVCLLGLLCGCGDRGGEPETPAPETGAAPAESSAGGPETMELLYAEPFYPFEAGRSVRGLARLGDRLLLYGNKDGQPGLGQCTWSLSESGRASVSQAEPVALDVPESPEEAMIRGLTAGGRRIFLRPHQRAAGGVFPRGRAAAQPGLSGPLRPAALQR